MKSHRGQCAHCQVFSKCLVWHLDERLSVELQKGIRTTRLAKGGAITSEGESPPTIRVLRTGWAFVARRGLDGQRRFVALTGPGSAFGIWPYFGHPNNVAGIAGEPLKVCDIPVDDVRAAARADPRFSWHLGFRAYLISGLLVNWSEVMRLGGAVNQLAYALVLMSRDQEDRLIALPSTSRFAELLGSRRETIARALATLEAEGRIQLRDGRRCDVSESALLDRVRSDPRGAPEPLAT